MNKLLEYVEVNPKDKPSATVIWMHGLGADGDDFASIVPLLQLPASPAIRFIFPHAPIRPVTINMGMSMPAWFDIVGLDVNSPQDKVGIQQAAQWMHQLIQAEKKRGISSDRIILAGFSQGGAIALHTGLRYPERLAGILALSTFLPLSEFVVEEASKENRHIPIFMAHGTIDPVIPFQFAKYSCEFLKELGYPVDWHRYEMEHSTCAQEVEDISRWIVKNGSMSNRVGK